MPGDVSVLTILGLLPWPRNSFSTCRVKCFLLEDFKKNCIVKYLFDFIVLVHFIFYILRECNTGSPFLLFCICNCISHVLSLLSFKFWIPVSAPFFCFYSVCFPSVLSYFVFFSVISALVFLFFCFFSEFRQSHFIGEFWELITFLPFAYILSYKISLLVLNQLLILFC